MTVNLKMEPSFIVNEMDLQWQSELNFCENIEKIVKEFKECRKLQPIKILIHGPPAVGKTEVAKKLCELYNLHYISVDSLIKDTLAALVIHFSSIASISIINFYTVKCSELI